jgi:hypothetical protein
MHMSPNKAKENRELLRVKQITYPYMTTTMLKDKVRPDAFGETFKSIVFAYIPIHNTCYWLFREPIDLDLFKEWRKSQ